MSLMRLPVRLLLLAVLGVSFSLGLAAQQAVPADAVVGHVLDADGGGLAGAELHLILQGPGAASYTTQSGEQGSFRFENVRPGAYALDVTRDGYLGQAYVNPETGEDAIRVGDSRGSRQVEVRMVRQAIIAGQVLDADGQPVPSALVSALQWRDGPNGGQTLTPKARDVSAGADGRFAIGGLAAGTYYLLAEDPALWTGHRQPVRMPGDPVPQQRDLPTFYPNADNPGAATPIQLTAGGYRQSAEIRLRGGPVYPVSGIILDPTTGSPPMQSTMTWYPLLGGYIDYHHYQMAQQVDLHGVFKMTALPAGDYLVMVTANGVSTEHRVTVQDRALTGLELSADPGLNLTGRVRVLGEGRQARLPNTVALHRVGSPLVGVASARVDANGRFVMKGVTAGTYEFVAEGRVGEPLRLERIQIDGKNASGPQFAISKAVHLEVTLSPQAAPR